MQQYLYNGRNMILRRWPVECWNGGCRNVAELECKRESEEVKVLASESELWHVKQHKVLQMIQK